jgi:Ser-tRNA(Ala) deacylase AlaX
MTKTKLILKIIKLLNFTLIVFLLILTIFQIGIFTSQIYFIEQAERKIEELSKENQVLEEKFLSSNSLSNLEEFVKKENLVKAGKIKYIQIFEGAVLAK